MKLKELVPTRVHAEEFAKHLDMFAAMFRAQLIDRHFHQIVDLLTALVWDLAQSDGELGDIAKRLKAGAAELSDELSLDYETREALRLPILEVEIRAWAEMIDALLQSPDSEWVEREVAQLDSEALYRDDEDDAGDADDEDDALVDDD